jgi:hypothetical protein
MTFQELMTLVQDRIPVKIALFDNKKLGMIRQWQEIIYAGNYHSAHLLGPDYLISCVDAQIQHPGSGTMPLHTDQWWMPAPHHPGKPAPRPADARRNSGSAVDPSPADHAIAPIAAEKFSNSRASLASSELPSARAIQ